jgi:magnesium-dependent phosphatase-1
MADNTQQPLTIRSLPTIVEEPLAEPLAEPITTPVARTPYEITMAALKSGHTPQLLVFDCDWTLYPYDCDKDRLAPFFYIDGDTLCDRHWRRSNPYPDVPGIFGAIADLGIPVAFLSRNPSDSHLKHLLSTIRCHTKTSIKQKTLWDTMPYSNYFHAYSSDSMGKGKDLHFRALKNLSNVPFNEMLFFDDMPDNIEAAQAQGTTSVKLGRSGLNVAAFLSGIETWRKSRS